MSRKLSFTNTLETVRYSFQGIIFSENVTKQAYVALYVFMWKKILYAKPRTDVIFEKIEAIWAEIRQGYAKRLAYFVYRPLSGIREYYERIVDMFRNARMTEYPVISLGKLNFEYVLNMMFSTNHVYYIETTYEVCQLIYQTKWVSYKTSCTHADVIKWKHFPRYWPFVRIIHRSPASPQKVINLI